jgi:hypothetical protein
MEGSHSTMLQSGRSRVGDPIRFIQPLTEISTRSRKIKFLESRERPLSRADNLTAIFEPIV